MRKSRTKLKASVLDKNKKWKKKSEVERRNEIGRARKEESS